MNVSGIRFRDGENHIFGHKEGYVDGNGKTQTRTTKSIYRCHVCGEGFQWSEGCEWYGSIKDAENGDRHKIEYFCSGACASKHKQSQNEAAQAQGSKP